MATIGEGKANLNKLIITVRMIRESLLSTLFQTERIEWLTVAVHQFTKCSQYQEVCLIMMGQAFYPNRNTKFHYAKCIKQVNFYSRKDYDFSILRFYSELIFQGGTEV